MILSVAIFLECTLRNDPLLVIRGYNLTAYWGGGMLVILMNVIYCKW